MRWLALLTLLVFGGCATPMAQIRKELAPRVSEEFGCPEDQLIFKEAEHLISTTRVIVRGCDKHAVFVLVEGRWSKVREESRGYKR